MGSAPSAPHLAVLTRHLQRQQPANTPRTTPPPPWNVLFNTSSAYTHFNNVTLILQRLQLQHPSPWHNWTLPNPHQMLIHLQRLNYSGIPSTNSLHTYCTPAPTYHLPHTTDTAPPPHTAPMQALHYALGVLRDPLSLLCLTLQLEIFSIFSLRTKRTRAQDLSRIKGLCTLLIFSSV